MSPDNPIQSAFCRACGQALHIEAIACPGCGAPQLHVKLPMPPTGSNALAVVSCVLSAFVLVIALFDASPWTHDEGVGGLLFTVPAAICGALSLHFKKPGRTTAVVGLVMASLGLLFCLSALS